MARSAPRNIFGIAGVTPYSRTDGTPYGELRVLKGSSISLQGELIDLVGGSAKYPWASEDGAITAEMTLNVGELPDFMFTLFLGTAPTAVTTQSLGSISTAANKYGTTIIDSSNGIASVSLISGSSANLKFGKYVIKGIASNKVDLYYLTNVDIARGTDGSFLSDSMKVASSLAFSGSVSSVASFGLVLNQIGTLAFTTGDTATFEVVPVSSAFSSVTIGGNSTTSFPEFGALVYSQPRGNGEMLELDCLRCKGAGMPLPFEMAQFAGFEVKVKLLHDETIDGIFKMRWVAP